MKKPAKKKVTKSKTARTAKKASVVRSRRGSARKT